MRLLRPSSSATLGVVVALLGGCDDEPDNAALIERGRQSYAEYCALCHGDNGEGYTADAANALSNQDFLAIASDAFIRRGSSGCPVYFFGSQAV